MTFEYNFDILLILLFVKKMYIIDNLNCYYSKEQIQNYILNINAFEVLQNINSAFYDMIEKEKWADANCFIIGRLLFVICV